MNIFETQWVIIKQWPNNINLHTDTKKENKKLEKSIKMRIRNREGDSQRGRKRGIAREGKSVIARETEREGGERE